MGLSHKFYVFHKTGLSARVAAFRFAVLWGVKQFLTSRLSAHCDATIRRPWASQLSASVALPRTDGSGQPSVRCGWGRPD